MISHRLRKIIYIGCGSVCTLLAFAGVFLPGLPTTPFLLLASWFFIRSSDKLYRKLNSSRIFGPYLRRYASGKGIPMKTRITTVLLMLAMVSCSVIFFIDSTVVRIIVSVAALIGCICVMTFRRGKKTEAS